MKRRERPYVEVPYGTVFPPGGMINCHGADLRFAPPPENQERESDNPYVHTCTQDPCGHQETPEPYPTAPAKQGNAAFVMQETPPTDVLVSPWEIFSHQETPEDVMLRVRTERGQHGTPERCPTEGCVLADVTMGSAHLGTKHYVFREGTVLRECAWPGHQETER